MARPAKAVSTQSKHLTQKEKNVRIAAEESLRGKADKLKPPKFLNDSQKKIFRRVVKELEASKILGNTDVYILTSFAVAVDRLRTIEEMINELPLRLTDRDLISAKDKYTKDLYRCCNELSLSPQARAKIGSVNLAAEKQKQDPLLLLINGEEDRRA